MRSPIISSEQGLESYKRIAVEGHVRDILAELCKIDAALEEFELGHGIWFDNHTNSFDSRGGGSNVKQPSSISHPQP